jgi:hypothetical protein
MGCQHRGKGEAFYFALGEHDNPDTRRPSNADMAAFAVSIGATGSGGD